MPPDLVAGGPEPAHRVVELIHQRKPVFVGAGRPRQVQRGGLLRAQGITSCPHAVPIGGCALAARVLRPEGRPSFGEAAAEGLRIRQAVIGTVARPLVGFLRPEAWIDGQTVGIELVPDEIQGGRLLRELARARRTVVADGSGVGGARTEDEEDRERECGSQATGSVYPAREMRQSHARRMDGEGVGGAKARPVSYEPPRAAKPAAGGEGR